MPNLLEMMAPTPQHSPVDVPAANEELLDDMKDGEKRELVFCMNSGKLYTTPEFMTKRATKDNARIDKKLEAKNRW